MSIPPDILLYQLQVLAVTNLPNEPPEHIRQPLNNQVAALNIMRADFAAVKLRTACARRTRINRTCSRTVVLIFALPVITRQRDTTLYISLCSLFNILSPALTTFTQKSPAFTGLFDKLKPHLDGAAFPINLIYSPQISL